MNATVNMWIAGIIVAVLFITALVAGAFAFTLTAGRLPLIVRWLLALAPMSAAFYVYVVLSTVCAAPNFDWNGAKIAPAIGMLKGYPLYPDPKMGVMTAWIYGPVPALLMLPAALFRRPTSVIITGVVINLLVAMLPTLWLHLGALSAPPMLNHAVKSKRRRGWRWMALLCFFVFAWIALDHESMRRAEMMIAPDGPTVGLLCCSMATLGIARSKPPRAGRARTMIFTALSATCAVLACWCKQSAVPALLAAPIYLLIAEGLFAAATYAAFVAVCGIVISGIFLLGFGASNMWLHMVTLSASHPWRDAQLGRVTLMWNALVLLANELTPTLLLIAIILLARRYLFPTPQRAGARAQSVRDWFGDNLWIVLPIMSTLLLPAALLGYLKVGGYVNNFSLTHWFIAAVPTIYLTRLFSETSEINGTVKLDSHDPRFLPLPLPATFAITVAAILMFVHAPGALLTKRKPESLYLQIAHANENPQETAYEFALKNPGQAYFPWNVLSSLLAEGTYYHFEWGIYDRLATDPSAGLRPSGEQILAHLPKDMQFIAFGPLRQSQEAMRIFPPPPGAYGVEMLPGFVVFPETRPAANVTGERAAQARLFGEGETDDAVRAAGSTQR